MKNRQLMRLNKVSHNGIIKTVDCISPGYISFLEDRKNENEFGFWVDLDEVEFIHLTEEILLKYGFKQSGYGVLYHDSLSIHEAEFIFNSKSDRIKYLHEIQNLFYALTGTELTIKGL